MRRGLHRSRALALVALLAIVQVACVTDYRKPAGSGRINGQAAVARGFSNIALERVTADMDPAMLALARRHDPAPRQDYWGRVAGWTTYDLTSLPTLGDFNFTALDAQMINSLRPGSLFPPPAAKPFVFKGSEEDRLRAEECLTQAIYYEAATEPVEGMQAVAQTVLNRLRHPEYPKSICGVVYQGSQRFTGCQFSFTCDGSLARVPNDVLWQRARGVAQKAMNGFVLKSVGTATHYHADYVAPYWAPTLYKIHTIGRHIFYRWTGPWGLPAAFTGRYAGGENALSLAVLQGLDPRTQGAQLVGETMSPTAAAMRTLTLEVDGMERTYTVQDLVAMPAGQEAPRVEGALAPTRRVPTAQEVSDINARLKALEDPDAPISTAPAIPTADSGDLPIKTRRY
ncbi:MAG: cell wall hydrolase [Caulobacter sp.]|nr:cell wall hydrolase [Caulobacter sp.]